MSLAFDHPVAEHRQPKDMREAGALRRVDNSVLISTLIPVGVAFTFIGMYGVPLPGAGVPVSSAVLGVAAALALFARPTRGLPRSHQLVSLLLLIPGWLVVSTLLNHLTPSKRLASLAIWTLVTLVISSGRLCRVSAARGVALGLTLALAWGILRLPASAYAGRLSGSFGEPNSAGMVFCVAGLAAVAHLRSRRSQVVLLAILGSGVYLTFSRTSYLAVGVAVCWIVLSRFVKPQLLLIATVISVYLLSRLPESDFATQEFADRAGSDALRARISAAEHVAVSRHPVYGNGAGTSQVQVQGQTFYYHNSYLGLRSEGGYIALIIVLVFGVLLLLAMVGLAKPQRNIWLEASVLSVGVCALNLGNVLLTTPAAIAIGMSLRHLAVEHRRTREPSTEPAQVLAADDLVHRPHPAPASP